MVLNTTFNNISVISWRSVLLVEETVYPEKTTDLSQVTDILSHNVVSSTPRHEQDFELTTLVVMGTDCTGSCKSNYHMTMATTAPYTNEWWLDIQYGLREGEKDMIILMNTNPVAVYLVSYIVISKKLLLILTKA
jgi:hypothetical protein